jgi:TRAP-type C4-dicarboxylate transport system permease small subunit
MDADASRPVDALRRSYERTMQVLAAGGMGLVVVIMVLQVFYRYFLADSLEWAEEACRALLIWNCFLFAGIAFQRGEMASVESFVRAMPPKLRIVVSLAGCAAAIALLLALVYFGWRYAVQNWVQTAPGLSILRQSITGDDRPVSIFWVYLAVPIGLAVLAAHLAITAAFVTSALFKDREES